MATGTKRAGGRRGRPSALARISTADLRRELERRQSMLQDLMRQRDQIASELEELQGIFGSAPSGTNGKHVVATPARRGRPRGRKGRRGNKTNLATALHSTLNGKTMSVSDVTEAVQKNGYKTSSANFRTIVNQALISNPDMFKKVARGQYTAR